MAVRKAPGKGSGSNRRHSEVRTKRAEAEQATAEQMYRSFLDDPLHPDQASPARGFVYFAVIVLGALVLNLLLLIAISGGR